MYPKPVPTHLLLRTSPKPRTLLRLLTSLVSFLLCTHSSFPCNISQFSLSRPFSGLRRYVEFNPVAENVLMTTNADHSVQLCDVTAGGDTAVSTIDVHSNSINR